MKALVKDYHQTRAAKWCTVGQDDWPDNMELAEVATLGVATSTSQQRDSFDRVVVAMVNIPLYRPKPKDLLSHPAI